MTTYHRIGDYKEKANKVLFRNEFERVRDKLLETIKKLSKGKEFNDRFLSFLIHRSQNYLQKSRVSNDELILDFGNYLNQVNFGTLSKQSNEIKVR